MKTRARAAIGRRNLLCGASGITLIGLAAFCGAQPALAQDGPADGAVTEVIITGSRTIRDGSTAPTPVTVLGVDQLQTAAPRNLVEGLMSLPAFQGSSSTNTPQMAAGSNQTGSFLNLRGLGQGRTLVLLDGRRVAPASATGGANFNLLPQPLITRVDVVTGGASAAYGSDAVAGVVNVITDTNFQGVKGQIQGGISDKGDVGSYKFNLTLGGSYWEDRLHLLASYGVQRSNPEYSILATRPWASAGPARLVLGTGALQTSSIFFDVRQRLYNGGVILNSAADAPASLQGLKFMPDGTAGPFNFGINNTANNQVGGDGSNNNISLAALLEMDTAFARATFDVSDTFSVYLQGMASSAHNVYKPASILYQTATRLTVFEGNPFIPPTIAALLAASAPTTVSRTATGVANTAAGGTQCGLLALTPEQSAVFLSSATPVGTTAPALRCFRVGKVVDNPRITGDVLNDAFDIVTGFQAEIFGGYRLSGYYEHGQNRTRTLTRDNMIWENALAAADAIANPAVATPGFTPVPGVAAGTPVCRVSVTHPGLYPGCVPWNIMGVNGQTEAVNRFTYGNSLHRLKARQDTAALDLSGEPFDLPAGPLALAVGAEYRQLYVDQISDALSQAIKDATGIRGFPASLVGLPGSYQFTNQQPFKGSVKVKEAYAEVDLPLLRDLPLFAELSVNAAGRYTDYSNSGGVKTYKIGVSYKPIESLRFRGTYSRDIRAPSPIELFQGNGQGQGSVLDPFNGNASFNIYTSSRGTPTLAPEIADTYSAGLVFRPTWIPGLTVSVDWYEISIEDAIGTLGSQNTIDLCFQGSTNLCQYVERDTQGVLQRIVLPYLNLNSLKTSGIDFEVGYRADAKFIPGQIAVRALLGYLDEYTETAPGGAPQYLIGQMTGSAHPRVKAQGSLTYEVGPTSLYAQVNYIGRGVFLPNLIEGCCGVNTITNNTVVSVTTVDVTGRYKFGEDGAYEAFLTINNLFDAPPGIAPGTNTGLFQPTNNQLYDTIGRYYTTGLRFRF